MLCRVKMCYLRTNLNPMKKLYFLAFFVMFSVMAFSQGITISTSNGKNGFCAGSGGITLTASDTTAASFVWKRDTVVLSGTGISILADTAGVYTVMTATDTASITISEFALPTPAVVSGLSSTTFCQGGSVQLVSSASGLWSNGSTSDTISVNAAGTFSLTLTDTNGCSSTSNTISITVNALPSAPSITGTLSFCAGGQTVLNVSPTSNITWNNGSTDSSLTVTAAGNYSVTFTDTLTGCTSSSSVAVIENALPNAAITASKAQFCANDTITLSVGASGIWSSGDTSTSINVTTAGTYSVVITDANGCVNSDSIVMSNYVATPFALSTAGSTSICANGSLVLTTNTSGVSWSTGVTADSITIAAAGTYYATKAGFCGTETSTDSLIVSVNALPAAPSITGTLSFCAGGQTVLNVSPTSNITWNNGSTDSSLTVTAAGNYSVTFTDTLTGCTSSSSVAVIENALPNAAITASKAQFCANDTITLSVGASGIWSSGDTSTSINVTTAGTYSVVITDANGCVNSDSIVMSNYVATPFALSTAGSTSICANGSLVLTTNTSGVSWSTGVTADSITIAAAGTYYATKAGFCGTETSTDSLIVSVTALPTAPVISALTTTTFCQGGSVTLTASPTNNITWSNASNDSSISVSTSGSFTAIFTDTLTGCSNTSNAIVVQVNALPNASINASKAQFCTNDTITLSVGNSGIWSSGDTSTSIQVIAAGTYSVVVTDTNGCIDSSNIVLSNYVATPIVVSALGNTSFCDGNTLTLVSSATGVTWSDSTVADTLVVDTTGVFFVTKNGFCGVETSNSISTTVNALPTTPVITAAGATTFCQGGSVQLNSSATGTWSNGVAGDSISATTSGAYTVLVRDTNGCTATSAPVNVTVNALPTAPVISGSRSLNLCFGDTIVLTANGPGVWSTGDTTLSITTSTAGSFNYTVTDSNGCSNNSSAVVVVNALPATPVITAAGSTTICAGDTVRLTSSASGTWSNGFVGSVLPVTSTGSFFVVVTDSNGCRSGSLNTNVTVNPVPAKPVITANRDTLTSSSVSGNQWFNVTTGSVAGATNQKLVIPVTGRYFAVVTQNGCSSVPSDTLFVIKLGAGTLAQTEVRVYPNPTSGQVYVNLPTGATQEVMVRVMDASGRVVRTAQLSNNQNAVEFDLTGMSSGLYFVHLSQGNEVKTVKLMVK